MFILRVMFWLAVIVMILPMDESGSNGQVNSPASEMSVSGAVSAASATMNDMASFCDRNPTACDTGAAAWDLFLRKLENGIRLAYRVAEGEKSLSSQPAPGAIDPNVRDAGFSEGDASFPATDTLRLDDLAPAWRGPLNGDA